MTVFKTFWKVLYKYRGMIILYTVMLIAFGGINTTVNDDMTFTDSKPDIIVVDDDRGALSKNLVDYLDDNTNIIKVDNDEDKINDALFYRDASYVIYIPKQYSEKILNGEEIILDIKSANNYDSSLAQMILEKYIKVQNFYVKSGLRDSDLIISINNSLAKKSEVSVASKLNVDVISHVCRYFNFASYSIMAVVIFIVCTVLSSFHDKNINRRIIVSSMDYRKHNRLILKASFIYATLVWLLYVVLGICLFKSEIFTVRGLLFAINTFIFTFCSLTIALLVSTLVNNKGAISGIVNVLALGSAFLCGAFIPVMYLPESVLKIAHVLPSYWYINSNELLANMEFINLNNIRPVIINSVVLIGFSLVFIIINNIASNRKRSI